MSTPRTPLEKCHQERDRLRTLCYVAAAAVVGAYILAIAIILLRSSSPS